MNAHFDKYKILISIFAALVPITGTATASYLGLKIATIKEETKREISLEMTERYATKEGLASLKEATQEIKTDVKDIKADVQKILIKIK